VPESQLQFELRVLLYQLLRDHLGESATVGSDQFIYYDAGDPRRSVTPDVYVRLTPPTDMIRSWKSWERGAPDIAVEIVSASDAPPLAWSEKVQRYPSLGVRELIRFEPEAGAGERRLRVCGRDDPRHFEHRGLAGGAVDVAKGGGAPRAATTRARRLRAASPPAMSSKGARISRGSQSSFRYATMSD
jgi:Uma2 family endonuclease